MPFLVHATRSFYSIPIRLSDTDYWVILWPSID